MTTRKRPSERPGMARRAARRVPARRGPSLLTVGLIVGVAVMVVVGLVLLARSPAPGPVLPRDNTKGTAGVVVEEWEDFQ